MPSSEDVIDAQNQVRQWAVEALVKAGHEKHSAELTVSHMSYEAQIEWAEKVAGPIYRGAYSPY